MSEEKINVHQVFHDIIRKVRKDHTIIMKEETNFATINVDSLDIAEIILTVENTLGISSPNEMDIETYGDGMKYIIKALDDDKAEYFLEPVTTIGTPIPA